METQDLFVLEKFMVAGRYFIWLSGPINAGKSTIARRLCENIHNTVNIELDALSDFSSLNIDEQLDFVIKDAIDLARNWVGRGFVPVLNWPLYGKEADYMVKCAKAAELRPVLINLTPDMARVLQNRGGRALEDWELERIRYMYAQNINDPVHGYRINNGEQTIEETVACILQLLSRGSHPG